MKLVVMETVPDEEVPEFINLWDGPRTESKDSLIGYYLYKVSDHGLIYKEEE